MRKVIYVVFLSLILTGCGTSDIGVKMSKAIKIAYSPASVEEFQQSREASKGFMSDSVLDLVYTIRGDTLTEADLTRQVEIISTKYSRAAENSAGRDTLEMVYTVKGDAVDMELKGTFYISDGRIEDGVIEYAK